MSAEHIPNRSPVCHVRDITAVTVRGAELAQMFLTLESKQHL